MYIIYSVATWSWRDILFWFPDSQREWRDGLCLCVYVCVKRDARHPSCKLEVHTAGAQPKCHLLLSENGWPTEIEHEAGVMIFFLTAKPVKRSAT